MFLPRNSRIGCRIIGRWDIKLYIISITNGLLWRYENPHDRCYSNSKFWLDVTVPQSFEVDSCTVCSICTISLCVWDWLICVFHHKSPFIYSSFGMYYSDALSVSDSISKEDVANGNTWINPFCSIFISGVYIPIKGHWMCTSGVHYYWILFCWSCPTSLEDPKLVALVDVLVSGKTVQVTATGWLQL